MNNPSMYHFLCACSAPSAVYLLALIGVLGFEPSALVAADDSDKLFKDSVRPLFERKCFDCHSAKADEVKGNLKLETLDSILKGGDQGPAVVAGDPENSFLLRAIRYEVEDFQMPPAGRLSDEDIALVEKWIKSLGSANK
jgi:mono/diheme cytochrome c family protein